LIDHSLTISQTAMLFFHLKQWFWLYAWPMLAGFMTILGYQIFSRVGATGAAKWPVTFLLSSGASMMSLFGWVMMVRGVRMIPLYGCGVGLASVLMSRIYGVMAPKHPRLKIRTLRIVWRGDRAGIDEIQKAARARAPALKV
jgi:hypothetical protein